MPTHQDEQGLLALVEVLRRNAEAMEASKAAKDQLREALIAELARLSAEDRIMGEKLAKLEDAITDLTEFEKTRIEGRKEGWKTLRDAAKSPFVQTL